MRNLKISGVAGVLVFSGWFTGCAPSSVNHYLKSANAEIVATPELVTVSHEENGTANIFSFNGGYSSRGKAKLTAEDLNDSLNSVHAPPDNYSVSWDPAVLGFGYKWELNKGFDFLLLFNTDAGNLFKNNAGLIGFGVNIPFPWIDFRISPAIGLQTYSAGFTDSVVAQYNGSEQESPDTSVQSSLAHGRSFLGSVGITAWLPDAVTGRFIKPYVGCQFTGMSINTGGDFLNDLDTYGLPADILDLSETEWVIGLHYAYSSIYFFNLAASRHELYNSNSSSVYYRIESSIEVNVE